MEKIDYERDVIVRIFQVSNALQVFLDKMLKVDSLTAKQFFILIIIGNFESDPKIGEIAETFKTSHQNIKQMLLKLEKQRYIRLYKDHNDSRITRASLTNKATKFWEKRDSQDEEVIAEIFNNVSLEDMKLFSESLFKIISSIDEVSGKWD